MSNLILPRRKLLRAAAASLVCAPAIISARAQIGPLPAGPALFMPSSGFNPTSLIGTQGGFWRADMGVTGSPSVTAWADQGPHSNNMSVTSGGTSPTFSSTGFNTSFPGITFTNNGTTGLQTSTPVINSSTSSMFMLLTPANSNSSSNRFVSFVISSSDSTNPAGSLFAASSNTQWAFFSGSNISGNISYTSGQPNSWGWIQTGSNFGGYLTFTNQGNTAFTSNLGGATGSFNVGYNGVTNSCAPTVAYVLLTNNVLAAGDITNLKTWTNSNWGTSF